jgi:hypothetical protein
VLAVKPGLGLALNLDAQGCGQFLVATHSPDLGIEHVVRERDFPDRGLKPLNSREISGRQGVEKEMQRERDDDVITEAFCEESRPSRLRSRLSI